ncbi:MAG: hypothetical protein V3T81_01700 [Thermoanaerobaculia bacterium]
MPPHVFAVDREQLRYGRFVRSAQGFEVEEYRVVGLPPDLLGGGPLGGAMRDPLLLRAPLRDLMAQISTPVKEASLVLPDAWLRLTFAESDELPRAAEQRQEILRWKLRRLVPFRVEDLRLDGLQVRRLAHQEQARRILLGFAIELLVRQLEEAFGAVGVHIGQISNQSLSLLEAVRDALRDVELGAVVLVSGEGYSLVFSLRSEPVLHRFKPVSPSLAEETSERLVVRDLRLTRGFLGEQIPGARLGRILLVCPGESASAWIGWLERAFELPAFAVGWEHLPVAGRPASAPLEEAAPLIGAARRMVA